MVDPLEFDPWQLLEDLRHERQQQDYQYMVAVYDTSTVFVATYPTLQKAVEAFVLYEWQYGDTAKLSLHTKQ